MLRGPYVGLHASAGYTRLTDDVMGDAGASTGLTQRLDLGWRFVVHQHWRSHRRSGSGAARTSTCAAGSPPRRAAWPRGTNGSQFFIDEVEASWLNNHHTIFGQCKEIDVIAKIAAVPRGRNDRSDSPVTITKISIARGAL